MDGYLNGMKFYVSENAVERHRKQAKRHKKKRINKKWLKRYGLIYWTTPCCFVFNNELIIHPEIYKKLKEVVK